MIEDQGTRTLHSSMAASDSAKIWLSHQKLRRLRPDLYGVLGLWNSFLAVVRIRFPERTYIEEQLRLGDGRAAVVVSVSPLLVAAYTDELDCVAVLRFSADLLDAYHLAEGSRILTVNGYGDAPDYAPDLMVGPRVTPRWQNFHPLIADFLTDDAKQLAKRKRAISESEWQRTYAMGKEYLRRHPGFARDGRPVYSAIPAPLWSQIYAEEREPTDSRLARLAHPEPER